MDPLPDPNRAGTASPARSTAPGVLGVPVPPMRLVTKGWWVLREERATAEEIAAADREQAA